MSDLPVNYRAVIDAARDTGVIVTGPDSRVRAWNQGAETLLGWTEAEMLGRPVDRIFTPEDQARGAPQHEIGRAERDGWAADERWHLRKDGGRFYAHGALTALPGGTGFVKALRDITSEHTTRASLLANREKLELAVDATGLGQFDYWPASDRLEWDDRCRAMFGLSLGAPVSYEAAFLRGLHPDDRADAATAVAVALGPAGARRFYAEYRTIGIEDGRERHVVARGLTMFEGDAPVRLIGTVQDVTAARRADAALRETEERLRLAGRATNDAIWDWDLTADHVRWNDALERAYGHPLAGVEPTGAWWVDHIHPDDRARIAAGIHAVIDDPHDCDWTDEYRFRRADGTYADVRDRGYVLRGADGRALRMIGALLDQTDRVRRERGLTHEVAQRTAERDRMWNASPDLLVVLAYDGTFRRVNPAWTVILGYAQEELVGTVVETLVHPDDVALTRRALADAAGAPLPVVENRYRHKDGSYRWFSWVAAPDGDAIYATGRHVTEEKERQAALEAAEEQLRQAHKMEAVGQLTGGIAHDFNNMLTGVIGSLELVKRYVAQGRGDRVDRYIDAATTSAQRAAALTHRLLAFSRRQSLDLQAVDVGAVVLGVEDLLRRTLGEQVALEVRLHAGAWAATTDANQLESALLNLAINARDAMPGGGKLTIESSNAVLDVAYCAGFDELEPGEYVALCVSDTGEGMPADVIAKAFDPFFTTKPLGQGTGLGLSMIYGFVKQTGGHVRIYSEPGRGATVKLYLRRHQGEASAGRQAAEAVERRSEGERVMLVEDDPAVRMLVVDVLDDLGYHVIAAADGREAQRLLADRPRIDLLITDVGLPGLNGRQVADLARAAVPGLKVLFVTGYAEQAAIRSGFLDPGMDMIMKPFAIDALSAKIRTMIEG